MNLIKEPGIYPTWRDPNSKLGFQEFGRDVLPGYRGFRCYIENHWLCEVEAKEVAAGMKEEYFVVTYSVPKDQLQASFDIHVARLGPTLRTAIASFDKMLPLILEGWREAHHQDLGPHHRAEFQLL